MSTKQKRKKTYSVYVLGGSKPVVYTLASFYSRNSLFYAVGEVLWWRWKEWWKEFLRVEDPYWNLPIDGPSIQFINELIEEQKRDRKLRLDLIEKRKLENCIVIPPSKLE